MINPFHQEGEKDLIRGRKRSVLLWGLIAISLTVFALVLVFYFDGGKQRPGPIPPKIFSKIHEEKAKAQKDFAEFIQTPAGKLWQKHPYWDRALCQKISEGQVCPGMSKEQAREAVRRVVEIRRPGGEKSMEEWVVEGKGEEKIILKFDDNALVSVERK